MVHYWFTFSLLLFTGFYGVTQEAVKENRKQPSMDHNKQFTNQWFSKVKKEIKQQEYYIQETSQKNQWQSPNRAQNMRFTFHPHQVVMEPRKPQSKSEAWQLNLKTKGLYVNGSHHESTTNQAKALIKDSLAVFKQKGFDIEYVNTESGMRQNFMVYQPERKADNIQIKLAAKGLKVNKVNKNELHFYELKQNRKQKHINYKELKVWDANGKRLKAWFNTDGNEVVIHVKTRDAEFPVKIDPLSTSPDWQDESDQAGAHYGFSVSTAGDVNGDGYSDVIVGSRYYDNGTYREGQAFVYHGSSTGLSSSADWTYSSGHLGARFGYSVSNAGDVDGDGYSDVVIGATQYSSGQNNEGRIYVFRGGSSGLNSSASFTKEINTQSAFFGNSISTAGDVDDDGYSDIIAGAFKYNGSNKDRLGKAYIFQGSSSGLQSSATWTKKGSKEYAKFGKSVSVAGDVNGDGYDDVIIGAFEHDDNLNQGFKDRQGKAYVFRGSNSGVNSSASWTGKKTENGAKYGHSVSTAGDVNGDGYADVMVGAPYYDKGQTDEGVVFLYHGSSSGLASSANWKGDEDQSNANFGYSVDVAGDVNGDGYSDIIVGAWKYQSGSGQGGEGHAFIYHGSSGGLSSSYDWYFQGNQSSARLGNSVAPAGDFNGDGFADVIVGAYYHENGESNEGRAYAYQGGPNGLSVSRNNSFTENQANAQFGFSIASAGDVNGDGYSDVIVGARYFNNGETNEGKAWLYRGSSNGLNNASSWTDESDQSGANFGQSVATAGDVNADGYSDVIIGAFDYDNGQQNEGQVYVYEGSSTGLSTSPNSTRDINQQDAEFGSSVSTAGDVDGDGYSDIIVGAQQYSNGQSTEGAAYVYHGSSSGIGSSSQWQVESDVGGAYFGGDVSAAGDVNGDGYTDVVVGADEYTSGETDEGKVYVYRGSSSGLSGSADWQVEPDKSDAFFGKSVANAGDVNGDGYSDVIIGAYKYTNGETNEGRALLYRGGSSGLSNSHDWKKEIDQYSAFFGNSVTSAGDINGDGYADVIIGADGYDNQDSDEGAAFIYQGSDNGLSGSYDAKVEGNKRDGELGFDVATAGDVNGDGYSDVMAGSIYFDDGQTDEGKVFIYHGNKSNNRKRYVRLYQDDLSTPLVAGSGDVNSSKFGAGLFGINPLGRVSAKLVWETVKEGNKFSGSPVTNSTTTTGKEGSYTDLGTSGKELKAKIDKISNSRQTKVRVRLKYKPEDRINGQVYSQWFYPAYTTGFSSSGSALPIELIKFTGHAGEKFNHLEWVTASETNNDHFIIYHSKNGEEWAKIGQKDGAGTSIETNHYHFTDTDPYQGYTYYRLKQTDHNGSYSYSKVIAIKRTSTNNEQTQQLNIYPNPVDNQLYFKFKAQHEGSFKVQVKDLYGRTVKTSRFTVANKDFHRQNLKLNALKEGTYLLKVIGKAGAFESKFIKE